MCRKSLGLAHMAHMFCSLKVFGHTLESVERDRLRCITWMEKLANDIVTLVNLGSPERLLTVCRRQPQQNVIGR